MIRITKAVMAGMVRHAVKAAPVEACGYLGEPDGVASKQYRMRNTDDSGEHFSLDPREQFDVVRAMRTEGQRLRAVYHSHPATPARPSQEDIRLAFDPSLSYVIVSLAEGTTEVKSFRIVEGGVEEEEIEVVEGDEEAGVME